MDRRNEPPTAAGTSPARPALLRETQGADEAERAVGGIPEVGRREPAGRDLGHGLGHAGQDGLGIVRAGQRLGEAEQRRGRLRGLALPGEEPSVLEGDRGVRGEDLDHPDVLVVEPIDAEAREHDRARHPLADLHRDDEDRLLGLGRPGDLHADRIAQGIGSVVGLAERDRVPGEALPHVGHELLVGLALVLGELAPERDRLERPPVLGEQVDAAVVVVDEGLQLGGDRLRDLTDVAEAAQAQRQAVEHPELRGGARLGWRAGRPACGAACPCHGGAPRWQRPSSHLGPRGPGVKPRAASVG